MASSPPSRSTTYSGGDYRGCMGGIIHLFDFNQALAGRKLLTDKKIGEGLEARVTTPVVGNNIPEPHKTNTGKSEEISFGHEFRKGKKQSGTPIKSLIAQELSTESEPRNRTPNVVARLMGLDALPADSKTLQKSPSVCAVEKPLLKTPFDRKCHEEKPLHNAKTFEQKAKASPVHHLPDLATSKRSHNYKTHWEDDITGLDSLSFRNHPQEQQLQEFKNNFEAWQSQKSGNHGSRSSRFDDLDSQLAAKQRLVRERLDEAKIGLSQEKLSCSKRNVPQERLHESKEFLDAMDFLQCNKDFFMRFLQEPNSLFGRHLQDNQDDSVPTQPTQAAKHSQSNGSRSEACRLQSRRMESPESRRSYKSEQQFQKSSGADAMVERNLVSSSMEPSLARGVSVLQDQETHNMLPMHSRPRSSSADSHVPTRIVVLKPSPGRIRNVKSSPLSQPRSLKDPVDEKEVIREDRDIVLRELRDRLRKESRGNYKHDKRNTWLNEHGRETLKDPREIAQEIARQVRENVARDSTVDSGRMRSNHSTVNGTSGRRTQSSRLAIHDSNMVGSSDGDMNVPARRLYCDQYNRISPVSPCQNNPLDMEAGNETKEGKRKISERFRTLNAERSDELPMLVRNGLLRKSGLFEDSHQSCPGSKSSHSSRALGRHSVDGTNANENHPQIPFPVNTNRDETFFRIDSSCELENGHSLRHEDSSPKTLLRSRSVPVLSASVNGSWEDLGLKKAGSCISEFNKADAEKAVSTSAADLSRLVDASTRSVFSRKVSGLKSTFSLRRKQMVSKEHGDRISFPSEEQTVQAPFPSEEAAAKKLSEDICAASQKDQCMTEDTGPVADNESSVSSVANFLSLEPSMIAEDPRGVEGHTSQQFAKGSLTTSTNFGQCLEQERQENNAEYEQEIVPFKKTSQSLSANSNDIFASNNTELPKEQSEQPSPVSVLDVPFQEESSSPMDFKEISSGLQELRMHLRLLKLDEPGPELDTTQDEDVLVTSKDNELHQQTADLDTMVGSEFFLSQLEHTDFAMDSMDCPIGKEPEMLYVKDVLVASGFTGDSTAILTLWYAPSQPLDPCFFQKVEVSYSCMESCTEGSPAALNPGTRHLLFDRVNEVLLELLCPYLNHHPWMNPYSEVTVSSMPTGKNLVKHVWAEVSRLSCSQSESQDTLENLMTKDLTKGGQWIDLRVDIETVGLEVERAIFYDLIEETLLVL